MEQEISYSKVLFNLGWIPTCWTPSPPTSLSWWIPGTLPILSTSSRNTIPAQEIQEQGCEGSLSFTSHNYIREAPKSAYLYTMFNRDLGLHYNIHYLFCWSQFDLMFLELLPASIFYSHPASNTFFIHLRNGNLKFDIMWKFKQVVDE